MKHCCCITDQLTASSALQNINTIIYMKLLTYCYNNLICLTNTVQLQKNRYRQPLEGLLLILPVG